MRLGRDESGQSTTEYVLIIGLVSIPIYLALSEVIDYLLYEMMRQIIENFTTG